MDPSTVSLALSVACVALLSISGTLYVLMAIAVRRGGTPVQFLSLSFNPRVRLATAARVIGEYRALCEAQRGPPVLYLLLLVSVPLAMACAAGSFLVLAVSK